MIMERIFFKKMHGSGNDFVIVDNRAYSIPVRKGPEVARLLCRRRFGIGADGLILIGTSRKADFKWHFYNADGSEAEMCGNGGRCAARFAYLSGISRENLVFETGAGLIRAQVQGTRVKLELPPPVILDIKGSVIVDGQEITGCYIDTGVPHFVHMVDDIESVPVSELGRLIRHNERFQPGGTNCDFVTIKGEGSIIVRTYERGVEGETMACGTGAVASAISAALLGRCKPPVDVETWGGERLVVYFRMDQDRVRDVFLEGETVLVYSGILDGDIIV